ncbi:MAG: hypothetical protein QM771_16135 [Nitrospira sp.]
MARLRNFVIPTLECALVVLILPSCNSGKVMVSSPQVFTRERLLEERFDEYQWLQSQLDNVPQTVTFQGGRDLSEFAGFYNRFNGAFDPFPGIKDSYNLKIGSMKKQLELDQATRELREFRIEKSAKQDQPSTSSSDNALQGSVGNAKPEGEPGKSFPQESSHLDPQLPNSSAITQTKAAPGLLDLFNDRMAYRNAVRAAMREKQLDDSHDINGSMLYDLQFDITLRPGSDVSNYAQVKMEISDPGYCEPVVSAQTLNVRGLATVEVRATNYGKELLQSVYKKWLPSVANHINGIATEMQRRFLEKTLEADETEWLLRKIYFELPNRLVLEKDNPEALNELTNVFSNASALDIEAAIRNGGLPLTIKDRKSDNKAVFLLAISWGVFLDFETALLPYLQISPPHVRSSEITKYFHMPRQSFSSSLINIQAGDSAAYQRFADQLCRQQQGLRMAAATVEPKEYAQNISDVAARQNFINLVASLKATLPQYGTSFDDYIEYARRTQRLIHTILRHPLAIGFGEGNHSFGWILGPKFTVLSNSEAGFSHEPVRHSFRAAIVVPAWLDAVRLRCTFGWVKTDGSVGKEIPCGDFVPQAPALQAKVGATLDSWFSVTLFDDRLKNSLIVELPVRTDAYDAITAALLGPAKPFRAKPTVSYPVANKSRERGPVVLKAFQRDKPETARQGFLIQGKQLWRNPQVLVGNMRASRVHILPDMESLYAIFDFQEKASADTSMARESALLAISNGQRRADLTVITSVGSVTSPGAIIIEPVDTPPYVPTAQLVTRYIIKSDTPRVKFKLDTSKLPQNYHKIILYARSLNGEDWTEVDSDIRPDTTSSAISTVFERDKDGNDLFVRLCKCNPDVSHPIEVQLNLKALLYEGDQTGVSLLPKEPSTVVYFIDSKQFAPQLVSRPTIRYEKRPTDGFITTDVIKVVVPAYGGSHDLFYKAFPELAQESGKPKEVSILFKAEQYPRKTIKVTYDKSLYPHEIIIDGKTLSDNAADLAGMGDNRKYNLLLSSGSNSLAIDGQVEFSMSVQP